MAREDDTAGATPRTGGSRRILGRGRPIAAPAAAAPSATATPATRATPGRGRATGTAGTGSKAPKKARPPRGARKAARRARLAQVRTAFTLTRQNDPRLVPLLAISLLVPFVLLLLLGIALGHPVLLGVVGLLVALVVTTAVFGRRVQKGAFSRVEGQVGASAAVIENMRGDWRVTPAVGFTREQDLVHRVLGKPGIVLVAEGAASRTRGLIVAERKRLSRFIGDVPVYDVTVGDGEGQVPLRGLDRYFAKLPQNVKPKDVNVLDRKLKAMPTGLPVPKGPLPSGGRMPRGKVR